MMKWRSYLLSAGLQILLWTLALYYWLKVYNPEPEAEAVKEAILAILPLATVLYLNHYLLIPRLLNQKKYSYFYLALVVSASMMSLVAYFSPAKLIEDASYVLLFGLFTLTALAFMSFGLLITLHRERKEMYHLKISHAEQEMRLLKNQMTPHFLFNALNSIYSYTLEKSDQAPELLLKLSQLTRYQVDSSKYRELSLARELEFLENYLALEQTRYGTRCRIDYRQEGEADRYKLPPLLLIPLVENAFKHGVSTTNEKSWVNIKITVGGYRLEMSVTNSLPQKITRPVTSTWTGLSNTRKRLQLLYPERHYLSVRRQEESYQATLLIRL